jgi:hypothetical protein
MYTTMKIFAQISAFFENDCKFSQKVPDFVDNLENTSVKINFQKVPVILHFLETGIFVIILDP